MDKKVANNLMVGILVTVGFFVFLFILFNIGGGTGFLTSKYSVFGKFKDVKGLHSGSEVSLSGLRVGTVHGITVLNTEGGELVVELSISKNIREHIRQDSTAIIRTQGVLGDKYIEVTIGSPDSPILEPGSFITTDESEDLFSKGGDLVQNIKKQFDVKKMFLTSKTILTSKHF